VGAAAAEGPLLAGRAGALAAEAEEQRGLRLRPEAGAVGGSAVLQAVAVAVHDDAVAAERPLLALARGIAALQGDGGAVALRLPAQLRMMQRANLSRPDGLA